MIAGYAARKVPEKYRAIIPWLLLLPDLFALSSRLLLDPEVPAGAKLKLAGAIAYVLMPLDFIPEVVPVLGLTDDLAIVLLALANYLEEAPEEELLRKHWSGDASAPDLIRKGAAFVRTVLSGGLMRALVGFMKRGGSEAGRTESV